MSLYLFVILLAMPLLSFAQAPLREKKANGTYVQSCGGKYYTVDTIEALERYKFVGDTTHSDNAEKRVVYLINKISKYNPARARLYLGWYQTFTKEAEFKPNIRINPTGDLGGFFPEGRFKGATCEQSPEQAVFQRDPLNKNEPRYLISLDLWQKLDPLDQATLIMHELIYREFSLPPSPQHDSESTRQFIGWLNSVHSNDISLQEYLMTLQGMFVVKAEFQDTPILLSGKNEVRGEWFSLPLSFYENGNPQTITLDGSLGNEFANGDFRIKSITLGCADSGLLVTLGAASFLPNGSLSQISRLNPTYKVQHCLGTFFPKNSSNVYVGNNWYFNELGRLAQFSFDGIQDLQAQQLLVRYNGFLINAYPSSVLFYAEFLVEEDYNIQSLELRGNICYNKNFHAVEVRREAVNQLKANLNIQSLAEDLAKIPPCGAL